MGVLFTEWSMSLNRRPLYGTVFPPASIHGSRIQQVGVGMTSLTITPNKPPPEFFAFYTENFEPADLEILVLKWVMFHKETEQCITELANEVATWSIWAPYATKSKNKKKRGHPAYWLEWLILSHKAKLGCSYTRETRKTMSGTPRGCSGAPINTPMPPTQK